jgi:hypothetical protein
MPEVALIEALRKTPNSEQVQAIVRRYGPLEVSEDPPRRCYLCWRDNGLALLVENDAVIALQIFTQPRKRYGAFADELPFGIRGGMRRQQIDAILGSPTVSDEYDCKYDMPQRGVRCTVEYDDHEVVKYVSFSLYERWAGRHAPSVKQT